MKFFAALVLLTALTLSTFAGDWAQWRGPNRDGVSSEKGLIDEWPEDGPKLLWKATGVGVGFSSVSVVGERIYTMGDGKDASHVYCLSTETGKIIWTSKRVGKTGGNYKGTRCTPTVDEGHVYALGQYGDLVCLKADTGAEIWRKSLTRDFGGRSGGWNYTESPLIDDGKVIITPGGKKGAVVALNKKTGESIWQSKDFTDGAQYSSLITREFGGERQYIQLTGSNVVGLAAKTGKVLWKAARKATSLSVALTVLAATVSRSVTTTKVFPPRKPMPTNPSPTIMAAASASAIMSTPPAAVGSSAWISRPARKCGRKGAPEKAQLSLWTIRSFCEPNADRLPSSNWTPMLISRSASLTNPTAPPKMPGHIRS